MHQAALICVFFRFWLQTKAQESVLFINDFMTLVQMQNLTLR